MRVRAIARGRASKGAGSRERERERVRDVTFTRGTDAQFSWLPMLMCRLCVGLRPHSLRADRQTDRQTDRQADRLTDRHSLLAGVRSRSTVGAEWCSLLLPLSGQRWSVLAPEGLRDSKSGLRGSKVFLQAEEDGAGTHPTPAATTTCATRKGIIIFLVSIAKKGFSAPTPS